MKNLLSNLRLFFVLFIIGFVSGYSLHWLFMFIKTTEDIKNLADSFQAICIGIGALLSAVTFAPALEKLYRQRMIIRKYRKLYPVVEIGKSYKLVNHPIRGKGHVYLIDNRTDTTHHIENPATMKDLYFDWGQVEDIEGEQYKKYKPSGNIDTQID